MKRFLIRCLLTEKRLFKKISFLTVLLMVPVLVWGLRQRAGEEAGMISIGLYTDADEGTFSRDLVERFLTEESVLRYTGFASEEEALEALKDSRVDAVWIIPADLEEQLIALASKQRIKPIIRVVEREDDVALVFTREVLCSRIFPRFVYESYTDYVREHMGEDAASPEELREIYDSILWKGNLFRPAKTGASGDIPEDDNYLMAPLRGLLCIWMVIAGFAALLYHKSDERHGVYDAVPAKKRIIYSFGIQAAVLADCGLIYLAACGLLGVFTDPVREVLYLLLFAGCISVFCNCIGALIKNIEGIGMLIPFMVLLMVVLCPIFLDLRRIGAVRGLLPPFYYLKAIYDPAYVLSMIIYILVGAALCFVLNLLSWRRA